MDEVFKALADPVRRRLLDRLEARNGQRLGDLCDGLGMTRQAVSKHLAVLEAAGLVATVRQGREKRHYLNAAPINAVADRWLKRYDRHRAQALADLTTALEEQDMSDNAFVYITHVRTTPERLFQALVEPAFTERYWGVAFGTDWRPGSPMTWVENGAATEAPGQQVLEYDPPRRLSYTWHTFTPEWAERAGIDGDTLKAIAAEPRSKVTFELEPAGETVKLTVVHDGFTPGSTVREMIVQGWPALLSSLKTLLETGEPLPA